MVRAGGREIMDAVRISPNIGERQRLDLAVLIDAYPRNLPFRVSGTQSGFYGRYEMQRQNLNLGLNVLHYTDAGPGLNTTPGVTLDFAVPLLRDKVELYGEVGRDPLRRRLTTVGLTFPWLYEKTDVDVYLEYANLRASSIAGRPPSELTMVAYRRLSNGVNLVGSLSRFSGTDTTATLGISVGARMTRHLEH